MYGTSLAGEYGSSGSPGLGAGATTPLRSSNLNPVCPWSSGLLHLLSETGTRGALASHQLNSSRPSTTPSSTRVSTHTDSILPLDSLLPSASKHDSSHLSVGKLGIMPSLSLSGLFDTRLVDSKATTTFCPFASSSLSSDRLGSADCGTKTIRQLKAGHNALRDSPFDG